MTLNPPKLTQIGLILFSLRSSTELVRFSLCLLLLGFGCSKSPEGPNETAADAELRNKIVGSWIWNEPHPGGAQINGTLTLSANGTFSSRSTNTWTAERASSKTAGQRTFAYDGTWLIKDGIFTSTYTNTSEPETMRVGRIERGKIIRLDDRDLVAVLDESLGGTTNTLHRR